MVKKIDWDNLKFENLNVITATLRPKEDKFRPYKARAVPLGVVAISENHKTDISYVFETNDGNVFCYIKGEKNSKINEMRNASNLKVAQERSKEVIFGGLYNPAKNILNVEYLNFKP